jgi:hypothetical protein
MCLEWIWAALIYCDYWFVGHEFTYLLLISKYYTATLSKITNLASKHYCIVHYSQSNICETNIEKVSRFEVM